LGIRQRFDFISEALGVRARVGAQQITPVDEIKAGTEIRNGGSATPLPSRTSA
jgi:hypothetical protein